MSAIDRLPERSNTFFSGEVNIDQWVEMAWEMGMKQPQAKKLKQIGRDTVIPYAKERLEMM